MKRIIPLIKNILLVSYLKNKGIRRICFVLSCAMLIWFAYLSISNGRIHERIDIKYNNFQDFNSDIYRSWNYKHSNRHKKMQCAASFMQKQGMQRSDAWLMIYYRDITKKESGWCYANETSCKSLSQIANKPIHLKCGFFETYETTSIEGFALWLFCLVLCIYIPFIACVFIKMIFKIIKNTTIWIYKGFKDQ